MNELINRSIKRRNTQKSDVNLENPFPAIQRRKLSKEEIADASDTVRANLVEILLKISAKLASLPDNLIGPQNLAQVAKLTDTAAKLFCWPNAKPVDLSSQLLANQFPSQAINLALIHTTPEQLREAARAKTNDLKRTQS
jgi:hypothetical protein